MKIERILAAIDFSDATDTVIDVAASLTKAVQGKLCILHSEPSELGEVGDIFNAEGMQHFAEVVEARDQRRLKRICESLNQQGVANECVLLHGSTVAKILEEIRIFKADIAVIGSHEHSRFRHLLTGGVRASLVKDSPCPLLIVPTA